MRELKFRAWDTKAKTWLQITGFETAETEPSVGYTLDGIFDDGNYVGMDGIILMQYTGLKDKNGREIYEGDILETEKMEYSGSGHYIGTVKVLGKVVFNNGRYALHLETGAMSYLSFALSFHEVIGNIYEHPHLLKGDGRNEPLRSI